MNGEGRLIIGRYHLAEVPHHLGSINAGLRRTMPGRDKLSELSAGPPFLRPGLGLTTNQAMDTGKWKKLEEAGWTVGSADEFLELSPEESVYVALKLALSQGLRQRRTAAGLTQSKLAERIGSSQSRIAKAEASDPNVSVNLLIRALLATGAAQKDLVRLISKRQHGAV